MIQTSITAPCRRDQVADILTGAVLRVLATRAMKPWSQVEDDEGSVPNGDEDRESPVAQPPAERG